MNHRPCKTTRAGRLLLALGWLPPSRPILNIRSRIGELGQVCEVLVHLVAPLGRTEMGQARSGHDHVRGILMIDRREHAALFQRAGKIDRLADASVGNELAERHPSAIAWRARSMVVRAPLTRRLSPRAVTASARLPLSSMNCANLTLMPLPQRQNLSAFQSVRRYADR